jgi:hypothetical protein
VVLTEEPDEVWVFIVLTADVDDECTVVVDVWVVDALLIDNELLDVLDATGNLLAATFVLVGLPLFVEAATWDGVRGLLLAPSLFTL